MSYPDDPYPKGINFFALTRNFLASSYLKTNKTTLNNVV